MARKRQTERPAARNTRKQPLPTVSRSQTITTFGVGSVYELRRYSAGANSLHSVMVLGLDFWSRDSLESVAEPVLARALNVRSLRLPPTEEEYERSERACVPACRFPRWLVCNRCGRLGKVPEEFEDRGQRGPRCKAMTCDGRGAPVRLVMACYHNPLPKDAGCEEDEQPGHISDFPWEWWAFSGSDQRCPAPQLRLVATGTSPGLSGLVVRCECEECKREKRPGRSLNGVFGHDALKGCRCFGERPWLNDREESCKRKVRGLLRGASNVYFAVTASALSIPPFSRNLLQVLGGAAGGVIVQSVGTVAMPTLVGMAKNLPGIRARYGDSEIEESLLMLAEGHSVPHITSEREQRELERRAILEGREEEGERTPDFEAEPLRRDELPPSLGGSFRSLVKVHRLREVRVLRGFCRVAPPAGADSYKVKCAPLSRDPPKTDWLPATVVRGEGIYLELDAERVRAWEGRKEVRQREELLLRNFLGDCVARGRTPKEGEGPTARQVLVHTLAHLLLKQLSLQCGYSSASLRERLYVGKDAAGEDMLGLMIYTSTTGADGTLGGLVRQGEPVRFERTFLGALDAARWCSSDPLCIESPGQSAHALNLSACHACCLVSETSCELRNTLLDRALLLGTPECPALAFFDDLDACLGEEPTHE